MNIASKMDPPTRRKGAVGKSSNSEGGRMDSTSTNLRLNVKTFRILIEKISKNPLETTYIINPIKVTAPPTINETFI